MRAWLEYSMTRRLLLGAGALIGGASLKVDSFSAIAKIVDEYVG